MKARGYRKLATGTLLVSLMWCGVLLGQQVDIDSGTIEGKADGDVRIFLGIPYAAPPLGELRWKPPALLANWAGVRKATEYGYHCM